MKRKPLITKDDNVMMWKVNTPSLLKEMLTNNGVAILRQPIRIFADILYSVGERASELDDPKLNALMARLAIYSECDPFSPDYNEDLANETIRKGYENNPKTAE